MSTRIAELVLAAFKGRGDHVAIGKADGTFAPSALKSAMQPAWLARHLGQEQCLGFYLMTPDSRVWCSACDFDNKPDKPDADWRNKAERLTLWLRQTGLHPLVEISQSGQAAHVWLFFEEAVPAWLVREFWKLAGERASVPLVEVYPRQDELTGKGLGNLVRYPLWNLSRFVEVEEDWQTVEAEEALSSVRRTSGPELKDLAFRLGVTLAKRETVRLASVEDDGSTDLPPRVRDRLARTNSLLARRWAGDMSGLKDPSRSSLAQAIACELVRQWCMTHEVAAALRHWCQDHGYEKGDREDWISRTVGKAYEFMLSRQEERSASVTTMQSACHAYIDTLERGSSAWIGSGLAILDESIDGVARGEMLLIAGRPGHGKTLLALQWLDGAAGRGVDCLLLSEEMATVQLGKRAVTYISALDQKDKFTAGILRSQVDAHYAGREPIYVVENCRTIDRAEDVIGQFVGQHDVSLVVVDYAQLLTARGTSRYEKISDVSTRLKQAAGTHGVAMVVNCQMNREVEHRQNHEPQLADLRDAGQLEQDADTVLFVQWPYDWDKTIPDSEYLIWCKKRRNGPILWPKITTTFNPGRQRIGPAPQRQPGED